MILCKVLCTNWFATISEDLVTRGAHCLCRTNAKNDDETEEDELLLAAFAPCVLYEGGVGVVLDILPLFPLIVSFAMPLCFGILKYLLVVWSRM